MPRNIPMTSQGMGGNLMTQEVCTTIPSLCQSIQYLGTITTPPSTSNIILLTHIWPSPPPWDVVSLRMFTVQPLGLYAEDDAHTHLQMECLLESPLAISYEVDQPTHYTPALHAGEALRAKEKTDEWSMRTPLLILQLPCTEIPLQGGPP